jgi:hypothetical protein
VGAGLFVTEPGVVVAGVVVAGATVVVGAWIAGSDFSPQPAVATTATAAVPITSSRSRLPAEIREITAGTVTKPAGSADYAASE